MTDLPSISDESVLMKWMRLELGKINDGIVSDRKRLSDLRKEERPSSVTRAGKVYHFDKKVIESLFEKLPETLQARLKLPIICYFSVDVPDSCMLNDEAAVEALKQLGEISEMRIFENGHLWIGRAIAYAIMRDYPTLIQIMMR